MHAISAGPEELLQGLRLPEAYPHPVGDGVEVVQTHISMVFLAGDRVYKVKKALDLGFLDYSTLARRRRFCQAEVVLNRRLAPSVYLSVANITREADGSLKVDGAGEVVEHAVVMRRLPAEQTFLELLRRGELDAALLERLGARLARFHAAAEGGPSVAPFGGFKVVAGNCRENFEQLEPFVGRTIRREVLSRLQALTEAELARQRPLIDERERAHVPRDCHGDLRLEHAYHLPEHAPPDDLVVVDCIEFNQRFRYSDPVADIAFMVMSLRREGRPDLAAALFDAYEAASGDAQARALLPLYTCYRAVVRGKVRGFLADEAEVPAGERRAALARARGTLVFALAQLAPEGERPCLILAAGKPGTGKSTLAAALAQEAGCRWIRSDAVRKELAGLGAEAAAADAFEEGIYTPAMSERTYAACLERAEDALFSGGRVVVDACFGKAAQRAPFLDAARRWGVPLLFLVCDVEPEVVRRRLEARTDDPSDADWAVYQQMPWEPVSEELAPRTWVLKGDAAAIWSGAAAALVDQGLRGGSR